MTVPEPEEENSDDSSVYRWADVNQEAIELFTAQLQSAHQEGGKYRVPTPPLSDDEEFDDNPSPQKKAKTKPAKKRGPKKKKQVQKPPSPHTTI